VDRPLLMSPGKRFGGGDDDIREVWRWNFDAEFDQLLAAAAAASAECDNDSAVMALDTEFPGFLNEEPPNASRAVRYSVLRENVNMLRPIQLGIAVSSSKGTHYGAWSFNLEFDTNVHPYTEASVSFLTTAGLDFPRHATEGVDPAVMGKKLAASPLVNSRRKGVQRAGARPHWITFAGWYDFGYLVKLLTGWPLPQDLAQFDGLIALFCPNRSELRDREFLGPRGSLDSLARDRGVTRKGSPHTAGSDAIATLELFFEVEIEKGRVAPLPAKAASTGGGGSAPRAAGATRAAGTGQGGRNWSQNQAAASQGVDNRMWDDGNMVAYDENTGWDQDAYANNATWMEANSGAVMEAMQQQIGQISSPMDLLNIPGAQFQLAWGPPMGGPMPGPQGAGGPLATTPVQADRGNSEASWAMVVAPVNQGMGPDASSWGQMHRWGINPNASPVVGVMPGPVLPPGMVGAGPVIWGTAIGPPAAECRPPPGQIMPEITLCSVQVG